MTFSKGMWIRREMAVGWERFLELLKMDVLCKTDFMSLLQPTKKKHQKRGPKQPTLLQAHHKKVSPVRSQAILPNVNLHLHQNKTVLHFL